MATSKKLFLKSGSRLFLAALAFSLVPVCGAPPPAPARVETQWPGIMVTVRQITRLPGDRVCVVFTFRALNNAPDETYIANRPAKGFNLASANGSIEEISPYRLEGKGQLIDESTGRAFAPAGAKPDDAVHPGRTEALEMIRPNGGFLLGGIFDCPPLNQDDPPKDQWVSFLLPGMKNPIKGVLLPREENVPLDFYPKPRLRPPPPAQ